MFLSLTLHSVYERSIVPYCRSWNLQFAEELQARLPVELRNLIYHYLWDKDTIVAYPDLARVAGGSKCMEKHCACGIPHEAPYLPHFVKADFVGLLTAREIVRALYDAFHLTDERVTVRLPEHLMSAVSKDAFQVGLDPSEHLRSLVLRLKLDRLRKSRPLDTPEPVLPTDKTYIDETELKVWLKALLYIKHKANFVLEIVLFQRNIRIRVVEEVLMALTNVWEVLHSRDGRVLINWTYRGHWHIGLDRAYAEPLHREMDDFFVLQRSFWRAEFFRFLVDVSQPLT
jgi:predicted DNA binding CopG/RHH family protein